MAVHDHHRTPRDYTHDARTDDGAGTKSIAFLIGLALVGFIIYIFLAIPSQDPTGGITRSSPPTTTTAPTSPPAPATK